MRSDAAKEELLEEVLLGLDKDAAKRLEIIVLDYSSVHGMTALGKQVAALGVEGKVDHVVSCFGGGFKQGPISTLLAEDLHQVLDRAIPHLLLSHTLLPLLKQASTSSYVIVTGLLGEKGYMPGASALTIANATIYGIVRSLEGENCEKPFRINELRIGALIKKDSRPGHPFVQHGTAFSARLIGSETAKIAAGTQKNQIIRITAEDLAAVLAAPPSAAAQGRAA